MIEFDPVKSEIDGVPRVMRYRTLGNQRVVVELGRTFGFPATRFSVRDGWGRSIKDGGSLGATFNDALIAGLGQDSLRGIRLLDRFSRK